MDKLNTAYCSDKYQYTMGKSYLECGKDKEIATFNLFYRKAPENNNWAVVSGTEEGIQMVQKLGTEPEEFYEKFLPGDDYKEFRKYLSAMKFTGAVYCMREGEIAFPTQPIVTVVAPMIEAQVLETPMLCILNHQMAVATKASRVCRATDKPVSEFGSRRAHGPWAAVYGGKAAQIAGCASSSNILTGAMNNVPSTGTMAHSFVTAYGSTVEGEHQAFCDYIRTHRGENIILLIDTYDTLKCGVKNAIRAFRENGIDDSYPGGYGVPRERHRRQLSRRLRRPAGQRRPRVPVAGSPHHPGRARPEKVQDLRDQQPGRIPDHRPGASGRLHRQLRRGRRHRHLQGRPLLRQRVQARADRRPARPEALRGQDQAHQPGLPDHLAHQRPGLLQGQQDRRLRVQGRCHLPPRRQDGPRHPEGRDHHRPRRDEYDSFKYKTFEAGTYEARPLQHQAIANGKRVCPQHTLMQKKAFFKDNLHHFSPAESRLINPHYYKVDISDDLYDTKMRLIDDLVKQIQAFEID